MKERKCDFPGCKKTVDIVRKQINLDGFHLGPNGLLDSATGVSYEGKEYYRDKAIGVRILLDTSLDLCTKHVIEIAKNLQKQLDKEIESLTCFQHAQEKEHKRRRS